MSSNKKISRQFLQYIRPIWYFHLKPLDDFDNNVWVNYEDLSNKEKEIIQYDDKYSDKEISKWDASYQALMRGIIKPSNEYNNSYNSTILSIDLYRFMRKYYKTIWIYIVFIQRLLFLNNPVNELLALWKTRKVKNINLFNMHYRYEKYLTFKSTLIKSNYLISIIIPTFNRYDAIKYVLQDLESQTYTNFEVIIIDQSSQFNKNFYSQFDLRSFIIRQEKPALWRARNKGIQTARSEYILFLDDDSRIKHDWIAEHIKCLEFFNADISSGVSISKMGAKVPGNYSFFRWSDQLDTGNVLIKKKVFKKSGMFDEQFEKMRMGDGEFGIRSYLNGFKNISNPYAFREHLKDAKGGLRDMGHWDAFRSQNIFSLRPIPSVFYLYRKYWGNKSTILNIGLMMPLSLSPYSMKGSFSGYCLSLFYFFLLFPFHLFNCIISWNISSKMIIEGDKINRV